MSLLNNPVTTAIWSLQKKESTAPTHHSQRKRIFQVQKRKKTVASQWRTVEKINATFLNPTTLQQKRNRWNRSQFREHNQISFSGGQQHNSNRIEEVHKKVKRLTVTIRFQQLNFLYFHHAEEGPATRRQKKFSSIFHYRIGKLISQVFPQFSTIEEKVLNPTPVSSTSVLLKKINLQIQFSIQCVFESSTTFYLIT